MYSFILGNGFIQFYCRFDGKRCYKCLNNNGNGICKTRYLFYPELLINKFDGKQSIKCAIYERNL